MALDENPCIVFEAEDGGPASHTPSQIPLILIHDGGGTCFAYYCLNPLNRPVYEIHNPYFARDDADGGAHWPGGIPEMARHYAGLIRKVMPRGGTVLLGGWSLGGILSLEVARVLLFEQEGLPPFRIMGIAMVDSVCPAVLYADLQGRENGEKKIVPFKGEFGPNTKPETIERVTRCFAEARRAVADYALPSCWGDPGRRWAENGNGHHQKHNGGGEVTDIKPLPPAILLRAREALPVEADEVSFVDTVRNDRSLGWDLYRKGFFEEVVDIPGHHFNVFGWENIDVISEKLAEACKRLEGGAYGKASQ